MLQKLPQLHKSKFFKCFLIAVVLVFSYEVSKPKAFAPLPFLAAIGIGMAAEQLVTMGIKAGSKAVLKKQAQNYSDDITRAGKFDWAGTNPYRNKDGSITLSPTANDRAKMAGLIAGSMAGMYADGMNENADVNACLPEIPANMIRLPVVVHPDYPVETNILKNYISVYIDLANPAGDNGVAYWKSNVSGQIVHQRNMQFEVTNLKATGSSRYSYIMTNGSIYGTVQLSEADLDYTPLKDSKALAASVSADIALCNELLIPSTVERVYPAPMDMSSTYQMPNHQELSDKPFIIMNVLPPSESEGEITWEELDTHFDGDTTAFADIMDSNIDTYLENGDINTNPYTIEEINNYYTDVNYPEKVEDFVPELEVPEVPGENLPGEPVSELDHSIWQVMRNTYNYLDDGIDSSLAAMKGITDSAKGITTYLNQTMGWLPPEWRAVFTSAFVLGVFAHFLRR